MSLDLHIPRQEKPAKDSFPVAPRKVKRWLGQLSQSNLRETTRQFFRGLEQLNRLTISAKDRVEIMEALRPTGRLVLDNLEKRFLALGLPLPEKTRRIFDLNLAVLQHMAIGYKIALVDAALGKSRFNNKLTALASERAIFYMTEVMVRAAQVYTPLPKGLWQDMNRVYNYAEVVEVATVQVKDLELDRGKKFSPLEAYLRASMFTLARPESLRRGDAERVFSGLEDWSRLCSITPSFLEKIQGGIFAVDIDGPTPPGYPGFVQNLGDAQIRYLDIRPALDKVRELKESVEDVESPLTNRNTLSPSALKRLETNWGMSGERLSKRAKKARHAAVEVGLRDIHTRIMTELDPHDGMDKEDKQNLELTLQAIPQSERRPIERDGYLIHPDHKDPDEGPDVWDVVGSGNVLTSAYREELERKRQDMEKLIEVPTVQDWKLIDVSAGGYGLRWEGESSSKAHVGEVVGLRELQRGTYAQWRIGVIRWMQFIDENSFEVGIQALSPHGMAVLVERKKAPHSDNAQECLVLPEINDWPKHVFVSPSTYVQNRGNRASTHF